MHWYLNVNRFLEQHYLLCAMDAVPLLFVGCMNHFGGKWVTPLRIYKLSYLILSYIFRVTAFNLLNPTNLQSLRSLNCSNIQNFSLKILVQITKLQGKYEDMMTRNLEKFCMRGTPQSVRRVGVPFAEAVSSLQRPQILPHVIPSLSPTFPLQSLSCPINRGSKSLHCL